MIFRRFIRRPYRTKEELEGLLTEEQRTRGFKVEESEDALWVIKDGLIVTILPRKTKGNQVQRIVERYEQRIRHLPP